MGLDIIAMDIPKDARHPTDVPEGWLPPVIGKRNLMVDKIKKEIPIVEFSCPFSGIIIGDDFSLEIHLGKEEECDYMHFTARGNEKAVGAALNILQVFGIRGIECSGTTFLDLDPESPAALLQWRDYLRRATQGDSEPPDGVSS